MRILIVGLVSFLGYVAFYASSVYLSKDRVVDELVAAVERGDRDAALKRIDMRSLRSFLKADLRRKARAVRNGNVHMQLGPEPDQVNDIVDYYVQPDKIDLLFQLRPRVFPDANPRSFIHKVSFAGPFAFIVTVGYPLQDNVQPTLSETVSSVRFVFKATNWTWQVKEMDIPLFMVPRDIYTEDEIEHFLSVDVR